MIAAAIINIKVPPKLQPETERKYITLYGHKESPIETWNRTNIPPNLPSPKYLHGVRKIPIKRKLLMT